MTTYVAFLRGINVGRHAKVDMAQLRELFVALGHTDARTYIRSGNVIFTAPGEDPSRLAAAIEKGLADEVGVPATVVLRSGDHLTALVAHNPFLDEESDPSKLHVAFLAATPAPEQAGRLEVPAGERVRFSLAGPDLYLHYPDGYGRTKLDNAFIEKHLGVASTTRNWNTVTKLAEMAGG